MEPGKINRFSGLLLALGLGGAWLIFIFNPPAELDPLLGDQLQSKKYVHELRVMGGQGNVVVAEFMQWFDSRWHGKELAGTVAVLTVGAVLLFRFFAARPELWRDTGESNLPPPRPAAKRPSNPSRL